MICLVVLIAGFVLLRRVIFTKKGNDIKIDKRDGIWEEPGKSIETFFNHFGIKIIIVSAVYKTEGDKDETHESLKDDELEAGKKKEYFM